MRGGFTVYRGTTGYQARIGYTLSTAKAKTKLTLTLIKQDDLWKVFGVNLEF